MNRKEATELLERGENVQLASCDATGDHFTFAAVWLEEDGDLVRAHPTDPSRGPILVKDRDLPALCVA